MQYPYSGQACRHAVASTPQGVCMQLGGGVVSGVEGCCLLRLLQGGIVLACLQQQPRVSQQALLVPAVNAQHLGGCTCMQASWPWVSPFCKTMAAVHLPCTGKDHGFPPRMSTPMHLLVDEGCRPEVLRSLLLGGLAE